LLIVPTVKVYISMYRRYLSPNISIQNFPSMTALLLCRATSFGLSHDTGIWSKRYRLVFIYFCHQSSVDALYLLIDVHIQRGREKIIYTNSFYLCSGLNMGWRKRNGCCDVVVSILDQQSRDPWSYMWTFVDDQVGDFTSKRGRF
jgi:hypothetical protein